MLSLFSFISIPLHFKRITCNLPVIMNVRANLLVSGLVQGVGFRYFVLHHATNLGLTGFVRNNYSGEVEIEVEGDRSLIEELIKEVKVGPRSAHVGNLQIEWLKNIKSYQNFEIR
jgi:acylphosphatase